MSILAVEKEHPTRSGQRHDCQQGTLNTMAIQEGPRGHQCAVHRRTTEESLGQTPPHRRPRGRVAKAPPSGAGYAGLLHKGFKHLTLLRRKDQSTPPTTPGW